MRPTPRGHSILKGFDMAKVQRRLLGGSWVVISGVLSPLIWLIIIRIVTLMIAPFISTHEPPSRQVGAEGFKTASSM